MSTFANSEDPDEMEHNAAFHQGLHCYVKVKKISRQKKTIFVFNYNLTPLVMYISQPKFISSPEPLGHGELL